MPTRGVNKNMKFKTGEVTKLSKGKGFAVKIESEKISRMERFKTKAEVREYVERVTKDY